MNNLIKLLNEIKEQLKIFSKVIKKYPVGHNHYKESLKKTKLELRGKYIKMRVFGSDRANEVTNLLYSFLDTKYPSLESCEGLEIKIDCLIQDLGIEIESSESVTERIYEAKSPIDFHNDLKQIINMAKKELFIIEPFVDDHLLEVSLKDLDRTINLKILTNSRTADRRGRFDKFANMFKIQQRGGFEVRESEDVHDRGMFIDNQEGWVMGQSIKDAGKKPTYLIKLQNSKKLEEIYDTIWKQSKKIK